jgi:hypothetical protein
MTSEINQSVTDSGKSNTDKTPKNVIDMTIAEIIKI